MKTIVFHSYKGGVGRTLALVNFAAALSRLGKKVVALDLDIDAPGFNQKLADVPSSELPGGYVDYLAYYHDSGIDADLRAPSTVTNRPEPASVAERCQRLRQFRRKVVTSRAGEPETFYYLLLAGACDQKYWWNLTSRWFHDLFAVSRNEFTSGHSFRLHVHRKFFKEEREVLAGVHDGGADYLLVDCKSAREYSCVPLYYWSDVVVSMFPANMEGIEGAKNMHGAIKEVTQSRARIIPVVCRVGGGSPTETLKKIEAEFSGLARDNGDEKVAALREYARITTDETLAYRPLKKSANADAGGYPDLLDGHVDLFQRIMVAVKKGHPSVDYRPSAAEWKQQLTLEGAVALMDMPLRREKLHAVGVNTDDQRNVLLRAVSLQKLFDTLAGAMKTRGGASPDEIIVAFHDAGKLIGGDYGAEVVKEHRVGDAELAGDFAGRVQQWCKYDAEEACFGSMEPSFEYERRKLVEVTVTWSRCFLVDKNGNFPDYARSFLTGYLEGAMTALQLPDRGKPRSALIPETPTPVNSSPGVDVPLIFSFKVP